MAYLTGKDFASCGSWSFTHQTMGSELQNQYQPDSHVTDGSLSSGQRKEFETLVTSLLISQCLDCCTTCLGSSARLDLAAELVPC